MGEEGPPRPRRSPRSDRPRRRRSASVPPQSLNRASTTPKSPVQDDENVEEAAELSWAAFIERQKVDAATREGRAPSPSSRRSSLPGAAVSSEARETKSAKRRTSSKNPSASPRLRSTFTLAFQGSTLGFKLKLEQAKGKATRLVVTVVRDACEHAETLEALDELIAVNGASVPPNFSDSAFEPMLQRLKSAPRPLKLSFQRPSLLAQQQQPKRPPSQRHNSAIARLNSPKYDKAQHFPTPTNNGRPPRGREDAAAANGKDQSRQQTRVATTAATAAPATTSTTTTTTTSREKGGSSSASLASGARAAPSRSAVDSPPCPAPEAVPATKSKPPPPPRAMAFDVTFTTPKLGFVLTPNPEGGCPVVCRVHDHCEHKEKIRFSDRLVEVGGHVVPRALSETDFRILENMIRATVRPLKLKFRRAPPTKAARNGDPHDANASNAAAENDQTDAQAAEAEASWHDFVVKHATTP